MGATEGAGELSGVGLGDYQGPPRDDEGMCAGLPQCRLEPCGLLALGSPPGWQRINTKSLGIIKVSFAILMNSC